MRLIALLSIGAIALYAENSSSKGEARLSSAGRLAQQRIAQLKQAKSGPVALVAGEGGCFNTPEDCEGEGDIVAPAFQAETSVSVDSTGQHVVVGFNDGRAFGSNPATSPTSVSGFMYSDDGGATFVDGGQLPVGRTTLISGQLFPQVFGDPDVKYLGGCNFVYSSILLTAYGSTHVVQTLSIHRSTDCGHTWTGPFEVTSATNPNGQVDTNGDPVDSADKELSDVDPRTGRYLLCWTNFTDASIAPGNQMSCTYSDNTLAATPTFSTRFVVAATEGDGQGFSVRFAGDGSQAYVAWARFPGTLSGYANNVGFARSGDNGATWSAPVNLTRDFITMDQVLGNDRVNTSPSVAVDRSAGPHGGQIYVVYSNNNFLDGADVALQRSTDGGLTFSNPIYLNARPGADRAQWFPYITVDPATGRAWVFYYDQGVATSGDLTQVSYQYSDDGGSTWSAPGSLTSRPFKAGWGNDSTQPNLGDYNQAVAQSGSLYAAYAATRQRGFTDGQPATAMTTPDAEFSKITAGALVSPLRAGAVTFTESTGDGNIDPGDTVRLKVGLQNFVTNPINAGTATNITATLSALTPGVTVIQAASPYANLAPGANGLNSVDFVLQVSNGFRPGTPIEMSLAISSDRGSSNSLFTEQTGTPVYTTLLVENFESTLPGILPTGWSTGHGGGDNIVPWTTSNTFSTASCGSSNKAFHRNANDAPPRGSNARWERLFSPIFGVPANSDYVTVEFDVCYDTEDDPVLPITGYDGFFLRITDMTPGNTLRSVLAEAFEQEFTTGGIQHYPKHFPRNNDARYFEDMSAWSGDSQGTLHVYMRLPGMEGTSAQLRFEFAQDQFGICSDVRPGHQCGVTVDNVVVRSVTSILPFAVDLQARPSLTRDSSTGEIIAQIAVQNAGTGPASNVQLTSLSLNGVAASSALPNLGNIGQGASATTTVRFPAAAGAPGLAGLLRVSGIYSSGDFSTSTRVVLP